MDSNHTGFTSSDSEPELERRALQSPDSSFSSKFTQTTPLRIPGIGNSTTGVYGKNFEDYSYAAGYSTIKPAKNNELSPSTQTSREVKKTVKARTVNSTLIGAKYARNAMDLSKSPQESPITPLNLMRRRTVPTNGSALVTAPSSSCREEAAVNVSASKDMAADVSNNKDEGVDNNSVQSVDSWVTVEGSITEIRPQVIPQLQLKVIPVRSSPVLADVQEETEIEDHVDMPANIAAGNQAPVAFSTPLADLPLPPFETPPSRISSARNSIELDPGSTSRFTLSMFDEMATSIGSGYEKSASAESNIVSRCASCGSGFKERNNKMEVDGAELVERIPQPVSRSNVVVKPGFEAVDSQSESNISVPDAFAIVSVLIDHAPEAADNDSGGVEAKESLPQPAERLPEAMASMSVADDHPPEAVDSEPAPVEHPPEAVDSEHRAVEHPPEAVDSEPVPVEHPPEAVDSEPAPVEHPPEAVDSEHRAVEHPPEAVDSEPEAAGCMPGVKSNVHGVEDSTPGAEDCHLEAEDRVLRAEDALPMAKESLPVLESSAPWAEVSAPEVEVSAPGAEVSAPEAKVSVPVLGDHAPGELFNELDPVVNKDKVVASVPEELNHHLEVVFKKSETVVSSSEVALALNGAESLPCDFHNVPETATSGITSFSSQSAIIKSDSGQRPHISEPVGSISSIVSDEPLSILCSATENLQMANELTPSVHSEEIAVGKVNSTQHRPEVDRQVRQRKLHFYSKTISGRSRLSSLESTPAKSFLKPVKTYSGKRRMFSVSTPLSVRPRLHADEFGEITICTSGPRQKYTTWSPLLLNTIADTDVGDISSDSVTQDEMPTNDADVLRRIRSIDFHSAATASGTSIDSQQFLDTQQYSPVRSPVPSPTAGGNCLSSAGPVLPPNTRGNRLTSISPVPSPTTIGNHSPSDSPVLPPTTKRNRLLSTSPELAPTTRGKYSPSGRETKQRKGKAQVLPPTERGKDSPSCSQLLLPTTRYKSARKRRKGKDGSKVQVKDIIQYPPYIQQQMNEMRSQYKRKYPEHYEKTKDIPCDILSCRFFPPSFH